MKKIFFLSGMLILIGAGCFSTVEDSEVESDALVDEIEVTEMHDEDSELVEVEGEDNEQEEVEEGDAENLESVIEGVEGEEALAPLEINMEAGNFFFAPASITAMPGQEIRITFTKNSGVHTFAIDSLGLDQSISEGGVITFTAPDTPGSVPFYCSIGSHRALGMEGVLIVQ
jgi:plastocyanin